MSQGHVEPSLIHELADGLRRAAREVASDGKPQAGAAYLRQALALLPEDAARDALADLAGLESLYDMPSAVEHFDALLSGDGSPEVLADAASALLALNPSVRDERAWIIARDAIAHCHDDDLKLRLLARIGVATALALDAGPWREQVVTGLRGHGTKSAAGRAALGVTAFVDLWRGRPLTEVQGSAEALFRGDWVASVQGNDAAYGLGLTVLMMTDSPLTPHTLDVALAFARQQLASGYEGGVLAVRAHARLRAGDLHGAVVDGRAAFETYRAYGGGPVPLAYALAALVEAERELGDLGAARQALAQAPSDVDAGTLGLAGIRLARVRARAAASAPAVALDELLQIGADYEARGGGSPALLPWRSEAALLAKRLGRDGEALELAGTELRAAADAGPRALGRALAVHAAVGPPPDALAGATQAVSQLETVDAPLELARALVVQARANAAAGSAEETRHMLSRALELCERAQARPLAWMAREELIRVGGRPRRGASVGADGLTPAERAVARAAASGLTTVRSQRLSTWRRGRSRTSLPRCTASCR